jgi:ubiquinone/menaquinone biosynthesis C-methylase UbiE
MTNTQSREPDFEQWYRSSKVYRQMWVPHGIDQLGILRSLYKYRTYASGVMLDVGCGTRKFSELYADRVSAYWGLDLMSDELHRMRTIDVYGEATQLPFRSGSMSTVLSTQMLGYVYDPESMLREIARVLCPGGCFILTYSQSGGQSDPTDYYRFTPAYIAARLRASASR